MRGIIIGFILSFMAIFPLAEFGGGQSLKSWMEEYERFLLRQNAENFRREAEEKQEKKDNERKAGEEIQTEAPDTGSANVDDPDQSIDGGNERVAESVAEDPGPGLPETGAPVAAETAAAAEVKIYAVNGAVLAEDLQAYLYRRFCEAGIGWFYEYALLIAYQESRFNIYALNQKNLMDSGLFQFRSIYWAEYCSMAGLPCGDIFDPYLQIDVFTFCMARRLNQFGCSIPDAISRHKQSDYGQYDQEYVNQVMQHQGGLCRVK